MSWLEATLKKTLRTLPQSSTANRCLTQSVVLDGILYKSRMLCHCLYFVQTMLTTINDGDQSSIKILGEMPLNSLNLHRRSEWYVIHCLAQPQIC